MPRTDLPLWLLTAAVVLGFPALNFFYWPYVLESGVLPPDGDSIGIPMFGSVLVTIAAAPFILAASWYCLRRYNPDTRLLAWRADRPMRSAIATLVLGTPAIVTLGSIAVDMAHAMPWYEYAWDLYALLVAIWLLMLRAAIIDRLPLDL